MLAAADPTSVTDAVIWCTLFVCIAACIIVAIFRDVI